MDGHGGGTWSHAAKSPGVSEAEVRSSFQPYALYYWYAWYVCSGKTAVHCCQDICEVRTSRPSFRVYFAIMFVLIERIVRGHLAWPTRI